MRQNSVFARYSEKFLCSCAFQPERSPVPNVCSLFTAPYHSSGCPPGVQHHSAQRRWSSCRGTPHWEPAGSGPAAQLFQQNQPSSPALIIMKRLFFFFFYKERDAEPPFCGCAALTRDALRGPHWSRLHFITFGHQKPISGFHPGSGGLLSSAPCRTSRRRANTRRSIGRQWKLVRGKMNHFTKHFVREIPQYRYRIKSHVVH